MSQEAKRAFTVVFRGPCTFHSNCDETAVGFLHGRSASQGPLTEEEDKKLCWMCEGMFQKIRQSLKETGKWKCPVCSFEHTLDSTGKIEPVLSKWYRGLQAVPK